MTPLRATGWGLRLLVAAGLAVDCYVHADLAGGYDANTAAISQGVLFRVEAALAACAVVAVLLLRNRVGAAVAAAVAGGGLAAVLVFRYVPVGALGPFPPMYEPIWYPEKVLSAGAEGVALVSALVLVAIGARWGNGRVAVQAGQPHHSWRAGPRGEARPSARMARRPH